MFRNQCDLMCHQRNPHGIVSLLEFWSGKDMFRAEPSGRTLIPIVRYLKRISTQGDLNGYSVICFLKHKFFCFSAVKPKMEGLLPVTCVVVRCADTAHLKTLIAVHSLTVCIEVDSELVVKTLEERLVRHLGLEERNLHT